MYTISTNEVFHHLCLLTGVYKDRDLMVQLFLTQGVFDISKSKIKSWRNKDLNSPDYRPMPRAALDAFIQALYDRHLQQIDDVPAEEAASTEQAPVPTPQKPAHHSTRARLPRKANKTGIKRLSLGHTKNAAGHELLRYSITIPPKNGQKRKTKTFYFGENRRQEEAFLDAVEFLRKNGEYTGTDQEAMEIFRQFNHRLI